MNEILIPVLMLGGCGLIFGAFLGICARFFKVDKDERIDMIIQHLPGANCGGCGYAGCGALAEAVARGEAQPDACPSTKQKSIDKISKIMGVSVSKKERKVARVMCRGTCEKTTTKYVYDGIDDCVAAYRYGGGEKSCLYGCSGYGSCVKVCKFDAIRVVDGVAVVDENKCVACGLCIKVCPKKLIELLPTSQKTYVACRSIEKGVAQKSICENGCIGCKICEKNCESNAITVRNNVARIDYDKCTNCGLCAEKCPKKIIHGGIAINEK